jgi:hypothetical protein
MRYRQLPAWNRYLAAASDEKCFESDIQHIFQLPCMHRCVWRRRANINMDNYFCDFQSSCHYDLQTCPIFCVTMINSFLSEDVKESRSL